MARTQVVFDVTLTTINCGECGGTYAINERYRQNRERDGDGWNCPYCKVGWGYFGNGTLENLKKQLTSEKKRREWAEQESRNSEYRRRAAVGQVTKIKNRVGKGVCPCCNRHFENLGRHMASKHPDYVPAPSEGGGDD